MEEEGSVMVCVGSGMKLAKVILSYLGEKAPAGRVASSSGQVGVHVRVEGGRSAGC